MYELQSKQEDIAPLGGDDVVVGCWECEECVEE
jgi:hypothetical protein